MKHKLIFWVFFYTFCSLPILADNYKYNNYIWPVKARNQTITGSFGEFRHSHFHMGMDFATERKIGIPILSVSDGKIIKIQNSSYSYGNTVSILHDDGVISRYCHLSGFSPVILRNIVDREILDKLVRRAEMSYTFPDGIRVRQGDVIAFSGDTGAGPPHLHLELSKNGINLNPVSFGYNRINGNVKILGLEVKPFDENSFINGSNRTFYPKLTKTYGNNYVYYGKIRIKGKVGFVLSGHETSGDHNRIGFQKISLYLNKRLEQEIHFKQIPQKHIRWSPLVMDNYRSRVNGKPYKYFLYSRSNYPVFVFKNPTKGSGLINSNYLQNSKTNEVTIKAYGIQSSAVIKLKLVPDEKYYRGQMPERPNVTPYKQTTLVSKDRQATFFFPKDSVLTEHNFRVETKYIQKKKYGLVFESKAYSTSPFFAEFNKGYEVSIKVDGTVHSKKTGLYRLSRSGIPYKLLDSKYTKKNKTFTARGVRSIGTYAVVTDYTKPIVRIHKYKNYHNFYNDNFKLYLKVYDSGSKILKSGLAVVIDDEEAYVDYNPETGLREIFHPRTMYQKGRHLLEAMAVDRAGNESKVFRFYYWVK